VALADESTARRTKTRSGTLVATICACAVMFDGYDLSVFATTIPALLEYEPWGLDAAQVGVIASYALMGMLVGTLVCGIATDLLGRRRMLMASVTVFSLFMVGCALAPTPELFGLFRFLAGVGLGGLLPTGISLTVEFAPPHRPCCTWRCSSQASAPTARPSSSTGSSRRGSPPPCVRRRWARS
jgi:MFS transporter, AAHS family, benzoate transport protein